MTLEPLNDAGERAVELLGGVREQGFVSTAQPARLRRQAFTLFAAAYGDAHRAVAYLRPEPGARKAIVPTFYASRGGPRRGKPASDSSPSARANPAGDTAGSSSEAVVNHGAALPVTQPLAN